VLAWGRELSPVVVGFVTLVLAGAVLAAVHHAEVVAHRVGEPYGSLVLAVAVTVIEVALVVTLMIAGANASYCRSTWWTKETAIDPSPTADATRLTLPPRTSPTAKIRGRLVSRR
jgi:hypothetical protein